MYYFLRISPLPTVQDLIAQDNSTNQASANSVTVGIKGELNLKPIDIEGAVKIDVPISTEKKETNGEDSQQVGSTGPRITGSMVPIVHEDVVTRIKNIHTIYLGEPLIMKM